MNLIIARVGWSKIVWTASLVLLVSVIPVFAQLPTGTILGVVKDSTGGTVAGAAVSVSNVDTGATRAGTTGEDGVYRFPALPVGNYQVQVVKEGFQTAQRRGLTLEVGQEAAIDVTLQVGSTGQTVVVTEEAPQVNTTSSTTGGLVSEEQVTDLPLNGRNLIDLTLLQSGITQSGLFSTTSMGVTNIIGTVFSSNGAPVHSNNFLLDGAITLNVMNTNAASVLGTTLGVDGIKEYKVVSSVPDASYGLFMGATSTSVSKGGTNTFHGDVFEYLRNASLDARNYFDALDTANFYGFGANKSAVYPGKRIPPFQRNNFGGAVGGPIRKDKTFFFAVYEGLRERLGSTITTTTLPGNCFDQTVGSPTYHQVTEAAFRGCSGATVALVPTLNAPVMHFFQDNIFPGQVGLFPYPNTNINPATGVQLAGTTFNYSFPFTQPSSEDYGQIRLDQIFSSKDSAFGRFTQDDGNRVAPGAYPQPRNFQNSVSQFATISENHIFSPTVLNTLRFSFQRTYSNVFITPVPTITDPNVILVPNASPSFQVYGSFGPGSGVTAFSASAGADGLFVQNIYSYSEDVFWTKGKHAFKFGAVLNQYQSAENFVFNQGGSVTFSNLLNAAKGVFSATTTEAGTDYPYERRYYLYSTFGVYAQDDLRVTSRLALNLGLRYEIATVPREANGNDWQIQDFSKANGSTPTQGAIPSRMFVNPSLLAFSPRIGFAYDPFGKGTLSIRGGGGIYYDIGNYGSLFFEEACCQPPLATFIKTNNNQATAPYAFNVPLPTAVGSPFANEPGVAASLGSPSPRNVSYDKKNPKMIQYNLTIDKQLPWSMALSVGYIGSRGYHLDIDKEGNPTVPLGLLPNGLPYYCDVAAHPLTTPDPTCAGSSSSSSPFFLKRTNPTFGQTTLHTSSSYSFYNSLQVNVNKRISKGLQFGAAFTWAKMIDNGQSQQPGEAATLGITAPVYIFLDRGLSGLNVTENFRFNMLYHLPSFHADSLLAKPLNGWWLSNIFSAQSGYPITLTENVARNFTNDGSGGVVVRPDLAASYNKDTVIKHSVTQWFDPTMFSVPVAGTYGNVPRNLIGGPTLNNWDFSLAKDTKAKFLGEQGNVQFRFEIFNVLNHPNFSLPNATVWNASSPVTSTTVNGVVTSNNACGGQIGGAVTPCTTSNGAGGTVTTNATYPAFAQAGQITSTRTKSRQMQLALKIVF